ncbi:MAG: dienelactone hydrolase family protein, partial [Gemmatimonadota bacterium]|nr:dienelactone hydrolase family protein [Gemmatimonadota bacterium]
GQADGFLEGVRIFLKVMMFRPEKFFGTVVFAAHVIAGTASAQERIQLPAPSGPYDVGVTYRRFTDTTRTDPLSSDLPRHRSLDVTVWYPAFQGGTSASYYRHTDELESVFGAEYGVLLRSVEVNASLDPPAVRPPDRLPVVLFSHDIGGLSEHHSVFAEEFASQGYVVVGINHSYGSTITVDRRGRPYRTHEMWRETFPLTERAESLRWSQLLEWVADILFVHRSLRLEHESEASFFTGRFDLSRVFLAGHGFGGAAALHAAQLDRRIRAVVALDPDVEMGHLSLASEVPLLLIESDSSAADVASQAARAGATEASIRESNRYADFRRDSLLARAPANSVGFVVNGASREALSDLPVVVVSGETQRTHAEELISGLRTVLVTFLAAQSGQARHAEVVRLAEGFGWLSQVFRTENP